MAVSALQLLGCALKVDMPNQQDLNLVRKYLFSHVWHHMLGRMAGDKPVTNRTLSSFFICTKKNDNLATHMHTCKARLNPPLSSSSKYNSWKEKCQQTCFAAITQYIKYLVYLNVLRCDNINNLITMEVN